MDDEAGRYWCYQCSNMVNPVLEGVEPLTCRVCLTGFLELMEFPDEPDYASHPNWILREMLGDLRRLRGVLLEGRDSDRTMLEDLRRLRGVSFGGRATHGDRNGGRDGSGGSAAALVETGEDDHMVRNGYVEENGSDDDIPGGLRGQPPAGTLNVSSNPEGGDDTDHGNSRRFGVGLLRNLRAVQTETSTESSNPEGDNSSDDAESESDESSSISSAASSIMLPQNHVHETLTESLNPEEENDRDGSLTRTIFIDYEGSRGRDRSNPGNQRRLIAGNYYFGPNMDDIIEHLTENHPNHYGTPPACTDAVLGLPDVRVTDDPYPNGSSQSCTVCLEEFRVGIIVKEMPCKHRFHSECILPWLDIHSTCPVCRYQLPTEEESKPEPDERDDGSRDDSSSSSSGRRRDGEGSDGSSVTGGGRRLLPWPFSWAS